MPRLENKWCLSTMYHCLILLSNPEFCEAQNVDLVRYPKTLAPNSGSQTVTAQCADNASPATSLSVMCHSDGTWSSSNTLKCQCNTGYKAVSDNGREFCQGVLDVIAHTPLSVYVLRIFPFALSLHPHLT